MTKTILVTGGAGFVGSHACKALARRGFLPVVYDDLRRGNAWAVKWGPLIQEPLDNCDALAETMQSYGVAAVMHFAAYAYVGESMSNPSAYFRNNVAASINVLDAMVQSAVPNLVISSTCATYGAPTEVPISEQTPLVPINPYGASKVMLEQMAGWYGQVHGMRTSALRYFNAAGCDPEGEIGELHDPEPHLIPLVVEAALGRRPQITINGTDYPTPDGTAVRDYIHVADLADAHVAALERLLAGGESLALNLGTGQGTSIREVITAVSEAAEAAPCVVEGPRRPGDPPVLVADPGKAQELLSWRPQRSGIRDIASDAVHWYRDILPGIAAIA